MSWLYCEPKSSTSTVWRPCPSFASGRVCVAVAVLNSVGLLPGALCALRSGLPHADVLGLLQGLALRSDRRGDHHLDVLELGDVARAAHAESRAQRAGEVLRAIIDTCGTEQDLLERGPRAYVHARAARQVRVRSR